MMQVPPETWPAIAALGPMRTTWGRALFQLAPDDLVETLEQHAQAADEAGADPQEVQAFQLVAPLMVERVAIANYLRTQGTAQLRAALPEVLSPQEAVLLAALEYRLDPAQQERLEAALTQLERESPPVPDSPESMPATSPSSEATATT